MRKKDDIAVGIKLFIGKHIDVGGNPGEFEKFVTCNVEGVELGFENDLECKYYDDITGYIYFHFDTPVRRESLERYFEDEEIIDKLTNTENYETFDTQKQEIKQFKYSTSS